MALGHAQQRQQGQRAQFCARHKAKAIQGKLKLLEQRGVTLHFLPTYSPELNRIETLWRMMKHRWLDACHRTKEKLEQDIQHIFDNFGRLYTLNFFEKTSYS